MLAPYFDSTLPSYMHYASVGVAIGKEILRSITRAFDAKVMRCVPSSVNIYSNASRMDLLLQSGGTQIAYHSLLSLSGPIKGMLRLPNINMLPTQVFFLLTAQVWWWKSILNENKIAGCSGFECFSHNHKFSTTNREKKDDRLCFSYCKFSLRTIHWWVE